MDAINENNPELVKDLSLRIDVGRKKIREYRNRDLYEKIANLEESMNDTIDTSEKRKLEQDIKDARREFNEEDDVVDKEIKYYTYEINKYSEILSNSKLKIQVHTENISKFKEDLNNINESWKNVGKKAK